MSLQKSYVPFEKGPFPNGFSPAERDLKGPDPRRLFVAGSADSDRYRGDFSSGSDPRGQQYANECRQNPGACQDDELK